jgi:multidrug resistance efflux pump
MSKAEGEVEELRAKLERLTERCEAYKGQVEAGAAEIARLKALVAPAQSDALRESLRQYAQDLRRNPSGGDDYPFEVMNAVANRIDEILAAKGVA